MRTTCLEGLVGLEECEGGGASVEEPGCRGWRREGRGDGRGLAVGRGARVGGRGGGAMRVGGLGGGAIRVDGLGGGAMGFERVVVDIVGNVDTKGGPDGMLGDCGGWLSPSWPESVNVGTLSSSVTADAFGVVSESSCGLRTMGGGGGGIEVLSRAVTDPV